MTNKTKLDALNYEDSINRLEDILNKLEQNQLPLEESIKEFEQGVKIIKHCQSILDKTEQTVKGLLASDSPE